MSSSGAGLVTASRQKAAADRAQRRQYQAATAAKIEAKKQEAERREELAKVKVKKEKERRKGIVRYGKRGLPITEYLGEPLAGARRTLLGS